MAASQATASAALAAWDHEQDPPPDALVIEAAIEVELAESNKAGSLVYRRAFRVESPVARDRTPDHDHARFDVAIVVRVVRYP